MNAAPLDSATAAAQLEAWKRINWTELHHANLYLPGDTLRRGLVAQLAEMSDDDLEAVWMSLEVQVRLLDETPERQEFVAAGWPLWLARAKIEPVLAIAADAMAARSAGRKLEDPTEIKPSKNGPWFTGNAFSLSGIE